MIYQEDTIAFLQQICGLSGSEADNIRRAIGRKQKDRLDAALPSIFDGYIKKSGKPRDVAEREVSEFLQVIEDSASYQFGKNHSIAYCMLGYYCAYYRYYHPVEFVTSFLNNAANDDDIQRGSELAARLGIKITMPKWGISRGDYYFDVEKRIITKGLSSIKYIGDKVADELYGLSQTMQFKSFVDLLYALRDYTTINAKQLEYLIRLDFFSDFGNQRELMRINDIFVDFFKRGEAKKINKARIEGSPLQEIVEKYAIWTTKAGTEAKNYTLLDIRSALYEIEDMVLKSGMQDLSAVQKFRTVFSLFGYAGYMSGEAKDRPLLYVEEVYPLKRKKDGKQFGYSVITSSIGSGKRSRFTIFNKVFKSDPISKDDIIKCTGYTREGQYFTMTSFQHVFE